MERSIKPHQLVTALAWAPADIEMLSLDCFETLIWGAATNGMEPLSRRCFAFRPAVQLIAEAKRRGLAVAITSDTDLSRRELADLICRTAGEEVLAQIDHIVCSSDEGVTKSEGLFRHLLTATGIKPARTLHIGSDREADVAAPLALGIYALHLVQFDALTQERLRLEALAAAMVNPCQGREPAAHQAAVALTVPTLAHPAQVLGYATLGPVFHAYSRWLADEAAALAQPGGRTHLLFLTRDGHLPKRVFDTMAEAPDVASHAIDVSPFTASAIGVGNEDTLLAYLDRLVAEVRRAIAPAPGDRLMLAGVTDCGPVQQRIHTLIEQTFEATVSGRYLLMPEAAASGGDACGFIDRRHHDAATLDALRGSVALLEQLSIGAQDWAIDLHADRAPTRTDGMLEGKRNYFRVQAQQGCMRFARERDAGFARAPLSDTSDTRRQAAVAALARMMLLPLPDELETLQQFHHARVVPVAPSAPKQGALRHGLVATARTKRMHRLAPVSQGRHRQDRQSA